jgi:hypothetical protein
MLLLDRSKLAAERRKKGHLRARTSRLGTVLGEAVDEIDERQDFTLITSNLGFEFPQGRSRLLINGDGNRSAYPAPATARRGGFF